MKWNPFICAAVVLLVICFGFTSCISQQSKTMIMSNETLYYSDGSGNNWTITTDSIHYKPVTPEISSSGMYSGGIEAKKPMKPGHFEKIKSQFMLILDKKEIHIQNRIMTSGMLQINSSGKENIRVIIKNCAEKDILEKLLKETMS